MSASKPWPATSPEGLFSIAVDTREQKPFTFASVFSHRCAYEESAHGRADGGEPFVLLQRMTLRAGDYALASDLSLASVERKGLPDFIRCCGTDRDRFFRQIAMLKGSVEFPLLIIEADYSHLEVGGWRGRITPEGALSTLHTVANLVPVLLCRSPGEGERAAFRHLRLAFRSRYQQARRIDKAMRALGVEGGGDEAREQG